MLELAGTISFYGILSMLVYGGYEYSKIGWEHLSYKRYVSKLNEMIDDGVVNDFMKSKTLFNKIDLIYLDNSSFHETNIYYSETKDMMYYVGNRSYKRGYEVESLHGSTFGNDIPYIKIEYSSGISDERQILGYEYNARRLTNLNESKKSELKNEAGYIFNKINK